MAGNVYSTYPMAKTMAEERLKELEQDIFVCKSKYLSGEEFTLKKRDEITCGNYLYVLKLPFGFHFATKKNADREANRIADAENKPVWVDKKIEIKNGYPMIIL